MTPKATPPHVRFRSFWGQLSTIDRLAVVLLVLMAVVQTAVLVMVTPSGDNTNHAFRMEEWHRMWQHGIYYPRWLPSAFHGFGAPSLYFYPPLVYVISSVVYGVLPSLSSQEMVRFVTIFTALCSLATFRFYLRSRSIGGWSASIAALLYAFAPYRYLDMQVRGAIAEHTAFIFLPIILFGADRLLIDGKKDRAAVLAIALGCFGLLVTNIPASVVGLLGLAVYAAVQYRAETSSRVWIVAASAGLGTLLAAFSLLPALMFGGDIRHELFQQSVYRFGESNTPLLDIFAHKNITIDVVGVLTILGALLLLPALRESRSAEAASQRAPDRALRWTILTVLFVQIPYLSILLFKYLPLGVIVQFPWRFDMLLMPVVGVLLARQLDTQRARMASLIAIAWTCLLFAIMTARFSGFAINPHPRATWGDSWEYMVPKWALPQDTTTDKTLNPYRVLPEISVDRLGTLETAQLLGSGPYEDSIDVHFDRQHIISFHRYYWPQWRLTSNGQSVGTAVDTVGRLIASIGPGRQRIRLQLIPSPAEWAGWLISVAALGAVCWVGVRRKERKA